MFYQQLQITTHKYRYSTLIFIAGDWNAKMGRKLDEFEFFVGHVYSKKVWISKWKWWSPCSVCCLLWPFSCHLSRYISTLHGTFLNRNTERNQDYHYQIDYIVLCQLVDKQILLNVPPEVKSPELIIVL